MALEKAPKGVEKPPIHLTDIMRQPWPPQSQNSFCYLFARVTFPKFLLLQPIPFSDRMIAQFSFKQLIKGKRFF
jgi:hypothetical protein